MVCNMDGFYRLLIDSLGTIHRWTDRYLGDRYASRSNVIARAAAVEYLIYLGMYVHYLGSYSLQRGKVRGR